MEMAILIRVCAAWFKHTVMHAIASVKLCIPVADLQEECVFYGATNGSVDACLLTAYTWCDIG